MCTIKRLRCILHWKRSVLCMNSQTEMFRRIVRISLFWQSVVVLSLWLSWSKGTWWREFEVVLVPFKRARPYCPSNSPSSGCDFTQFDWEIDQNVSEVVPRDLAFIQQTDRVSYVLAVFEKTEIFVRLKSLKEISTLKSIPISLRHSTAPFPQAVRCALL